MFEIILFSHGPLAEAFLKTSEMVTGQAENITFFSILPGCNLEEKMEEVRSCIKDLNRSNKKILVLTDIFFGTPFNTMLQIIDDNFNVYHITGTNLPILVEAVSLQRQGREDMKEIVEYLVDIGKQSIKDCNDI